MAILSARDGVKNAAGFDFLAAPSPARTILLRSAGGASAGKLAGTISSKTHGSPAFAKCAAIREPIVPAPSTTAFSMRLSIASLFCGKTLGTTGYKTSKQRSNTGMARRNRSEEHTSELQSRLHLVCRLLLEKKKKNKMRMKDV